MFLMFHLSHVGNNDNMLDQSFVLLVFRLHRTAQSVDLLPVCYAANTACAIVVIMTALIFIIVSHSHVLLLLVVIIHALW